MVTLQGAGAAAAAAATTVTAAPCPLWLLPDATHQAKAKASPCRLMFSIWLQQKESSVKL